jgi:hypothetical protein
MTQDQIQIARALVASPHWRWMPGMLTESSNNYHRPARIEALDGDTCGLTVIPDSDGPIFAAHHEWGIAGSFPRGCTLPDLTDPATIGCLHALACERWGGWVIEAIPWDHRAWWMAVCVPGSPSVTNPNNRGPVPRAICGAFPDNPHTAACIAALLREDTP